MRKLPPTKATPQLKEAAQAHQAARQQLAREGRYACCIKGGCGMCVQDGGACPCARLLAAGHGVCGECWESWQSGRGAMGVDPKTVKLRPHPASEEDFQKGLPPTQAGPMVVKDRTALDNAKRIMFGETRYNCCVRPGCDSCAREGDCPCGSAVVAGKGVCGECVDGWNSGHGAFASVDPKEVKLEPVAPSGHPMPAENGAQPGQATGGSQGMGGTMKGGGRTSMEHGGMVMDAGIPGVIMSRHGSGTSWQPDDSPMFHLMLNRRHGGMEHGGMHGAMADAECGGGEPTRLVALLAQDLPPPHTHPPFPEVMPQVTPPPPGQPGAMTMPGQPMTGMQMAGMRHPWMTMLMGNAFLDGDHQDRPRGSTRVVSENWAMGMAERMIGKGQLMARLMMSLEPATIGNNGMPQLFQVGEGLIDRQHPHDFVMEAAAQYARPINDNLAWTLYVAPVGEPALGPPAFMHRVSALENPQVPLEHHFQDSTHISDGVITAGVQSPQLRLEASYFNAHEPDNANRWDIDRITLNSASVRVDYNPGRHLAMQLSRGWLNSPELQEPGVDVTRTTFSTIYSRTHPHGYEAAAFIWGRNEKLLPGVPPRDGILAEGIINWADRNNLFGRIERLDRDELFPSGPLANAAFTINEFEGGYSRSVARLGSFDVAVGGALTFNLIPEALKPVYGDLPLGWQLFLRLRPRRSSMDHGHGADGGNGEGKGKEVTRG
jgi:hypothetical protein